MQIAIPVFDEMTALDAVGPYEVLSRVPGATVTWVAMASSLQPVRADRGLRIVPDAVLEDVPGPDVLVFPGGFGTRALARDARVTDWVRRVHASTTWTTSVCTGAIVLGAAGLLEGLTATTHWATYAELAATGAVPVAERVVEHERLMIGAGVSAGIDLALTLVARLTHDDVARAIQLGIEYDPRPPFDAGTPAKAGADIVALVRAHRFD
jgi:transcriptional regulator GlxA family with amidase domain